MSDPQMPDGRDSMPWSAGQTLALALVIALLLPFVNMVVAMVMAGFAAAQDPTFDSPQFYRQLRQNGGYLTFASLAANIVTLWVVIRFIQWRKAVTWGTYLALRLPGRSGWSTAFITAVLFLVASQVVSSLFQRPDYPEFLQQVYASATPMVLFWIAVGIVAPVAEEVYFRGFVYIGLRNSALGVAGAIVVTAAIWSMIHLQYDAYDKVEIFLLGLLLGWLRFRYNSLLVPITAHALINLLVLAGLASTVA